MAEGYKDFTDGSRLYAAEIEEYAQNQAVMRFADAAARDTALATVKTEGMLAYLKDVNTLTVYTGSAWSTLGPAHGSLLSWATPTITQSGTVTATSSFARYRRFGRWIDAQCFLTVTGTGTSSNRVEILLPVAASSSLGLIVGRGYIYDQTPANTGIYRGDVILTGAGARVYLLDSTVAATAAGDGTGRADMGSGVNTFNAALAAGDLIALTLGYEAAADA